MRGHARGRGEGTPDPSSPFPSAVRALFPLLALLLAGGCGRARPPLIVSPGAEPPPVRIALLASAMEVVLGSPQPFVVADRLGILSVGSPGDSVTVLAEDTGIAIVDVDGDLVARGEGPFWIRPTDPSLEVRVGGKLYPGHVVVRASPGGGFHVINVVDLETYLRGVVPAEIGHAGDYLEAARAQAVAARTYALRHLNRNARDGFDLEAGTNDQVYAALDRRHPDADRAVAETRGLVLVVDNRPIDARYASTCGGRIAGIEESFDAKPVPYLKAHDDEPTGRPACRGSRYFRWEETWSVSDLFVVLGRTVPKVTGKAWKGRRIRDIRIEGRGASGRALALIVETDEARYEIRKGAIRAALVTPGGSPLRSTWFELSLERRDGAIVSVTARGRGWGHGVGMCQWGAMQLATEGVRFDRILAHYYPGADLLRIY